MSVLSKKSLIVPPHRLATLALAASLSLLATTACADERTELEQLRATTMSLMQALIDSGLLSREKADDIVRQAQKSAPRALEASNTAAPSPAGEPGKPAVIRVPYVSETTKAQLRDEIKREVLAQAHDERWGDPGALPAWLRSISVEGDLRARWQQDMFDRRNTGPDDLNAGFAYQSFETLAWAPDLINTQHDRNRFTLRARAGIKSELGEGFKAGIRISTGNATNPIAASQTQGNYFDKYSVLFDQAYLRYDQKDGRVSAVAGRFANPFYGTDLSWPDDLNFDGLAASVKTTFGPGQMAFANAGVFPLQELETSSNDKWLYGAQIGLSWPVSPLTQFRAGLAMYDFHGAEGVQDTQLKPAVPSAQAYASSRYPEGVRQKGNTLMRLNNGADTVSDPSIWGLASRFKPIDLTMDMTFQHFFPINVKASLDIIKNIGFDYDDIVRRGGDNLVGLPIANQTLAMQAKIGVGVDRIDRAGQWQTFLAIRRFERDAWVDAFTDTTWHLGGTNYQGWSIGGQYGVGPRTSLGGRWTSTRNLNDSTVYNNVGPGLSNATLKIDVLQLELNTRF